MISINPYEPIPLLYQMPPGGDLLVSLGHQVQRVLSRMAAGSLPPHNLPSPDAESPTLEDTSSRPHLFTVAMDAFASMVCGGGNQAIIVNGESGAGKTEACKVLLRFLASLSAVFSNRPVSVGLDLNGTCTVALWLGSGQG